MNFVFISPHFPHTYWNFCDRLKRNGVTVLGIGDTPYDNLEPPLKEALTDNPAWAGLTAVKEGRVHMMERSLFHFKPNNRWGTAYAELEAILYND